LRNIVIGRAPLNLDVLGVPATIGSVEQRPRRSRKLPHVRRTEILRSTVQLAIEVSLNQITIREVARMAGVGTGLVHHYFSDREQLITEAFEYWCLCELGEWVEAGEHLPALTQLAIFPSEMAPGERRLWYDALSPAAPGNSTMLRDTARRLSLDYYNRMVSLVKRGVADGQFFCEDAEQSAWRLILVLDALVLQLSVSSLPRPEQAIDLAGVLIDRELGLPLGSFAAEAAAVRSGSFFKQAPATRTAVASSPARSAGPAGPPAVL